MKLFTVGPVQMYEHTLKERSKPIPYFRTDEFSEVMFETDRLLKEMLHTDKSSESIYLTASGTAAMEATVCNCFDKETDKLLVVVGGTFGKRFSDICEIHGITHEDIKLSSGEVLTSKHLEKYEDKGFTGFLVNLDETSTGQLYDIHLISNFCKKNNMYLIVDAISTFLCDEYYMDDWGIDATILSTQKGLCLSPGMAVVTMNKKLVEEKVNKNNFPSLYFNFKDYMDNMKRGQTPFTPAVGVVFEIKDMLEVIKEEGLENRLEKIDSLAKCFRKNIVCDGIKLPDYPLSNAITPIVLEKPVAMNIFRDLKDKYHIFVNPTGGATADHVLRIAHVGDLSISDMEEISELIKEMYKKY